MSSPPLNTKNMENMCAQLAERATCMQLAYEASVQQSVPVGRIDYVANANKRAIEEDTGGAASNRAYEESTGGAVSKRFKHSLWTLMMSTGFALMTRKIDNCHIR